MLAVLDHVGDGQVMIPLFREERYESNGAEQQTGADGSPDTPTGLLPIFEVDDRLPWNLEFDTLIWFLLGQENQVDFMRGVQDALDRILGPHEARLGAAEVGGLRPDGMPSIESIAAGTTRLRFLKAAGKPFDDEEIGAVTWDVWMEKGWGRR
jgi:hypothetical protein